MSFRATHLRRPTAIETPVDSYVADRRRMVTERLRLAATLGVVPFTLSALMDGVIFPDRHPHGFTASVIQAALCVVVALLTLRKRSERGAIVLAASSVVGLVAIQLIATFEHAADIAGVLYPMVATLLGSALLFPWGIGPQLVVSVAVALLYLVILPEWITLDFMSICTLLMGTGIGVAIAVTGAYLLDRQHRTTDEQQRATTLARERVQAAARQTQILLEVGRELNATIDLSQLVRLVTRLGQRIVVCDVAMLSVLDTRRGVFRTIAISGDDPAMAEALRGVEMPADPLVVEELMHHRVVAVPGGTPFDRLLNVGARYGVQQMLLAAVRRDGDLLGVLTFMQRAGVPRFGEHCTRLAEGIAHQAAIALANARLFEQLRSASQVKSTFVSTMSHELRTPINIILGFAEIARDHGVAEGERTECLTKIDTAARDLLELVESTLAIGKMDAGRDDVHLEPVGLQEFWDALGSFCGRLPRKPGVSLDWSRDVAAETLVTDPRKLTVVLRNLVGNALKFTERGRVRAWTHVVGNRLVIAVADTGIGIRPEDQKKVFEMFRQADGSDSRRFGGTGLGLFICRQYIEQLGGTIEVESVPQRGSTFRVSLPLRSVVAARNAA